MVLVVYIVDCSVYGLAANICLLVTWYVGLLVCMCCI